MVFNETVGTSVGDEGCTGKKSCVPAVADSELASVAVTFTDQIPLPLGVNVKSGVVVVPPSGRLKATPFSFVTDHVYSKLSPLPLELVLVAEMVREEPFVAAGILFNVRMGKKWPL